MNKSSEVTKSILLRLNDDNYQNSEKELNLKDYTDITHNFINNFKKHIINLKEQLAHGISKEGNEDKDKINKVIDKIIKEIKTLFNNYIDEIKSSYSKQYENILRSYEQKIRNLYENKFSLELNIKILEESNKNLLRKERENELIREETGIIVLGGKVINNNKKENEIIILRKENSILKDVIEKQKQELKLNIQKSPKKKTQLTKKLIYKKIDLSSKNKVKRKNIYESISSRDKNRIKVHHHSHPKSNYHFKSDYISSINNSLLNNKLSITYKSLLNFSSTKNLRNDFINNIFSSNKKLVRNKKLKKNNYINIKVQNSNNLIKKISPQNLRKKRGIPKMLKKNYQSLNKNKSPTQFLQRYKTNNISTIGINMPAVERDTHSNYKSNSKKKNNSEYINEKKINLLNSSLNKTINDESKYTKKGLKSINFLSPSYKKMLNLIPKIKKPLNIAGIYDAKISNSFYRRNNSKNFKNLNLKENRKKIKNNFEIKKIILSKIDGNKPQSLNFLYKARIKNVSDPKSNNRYSYRRLMDSKTNSKGKKNNINTACNTINNRLNKIRNKIIKTKS